MDGIDDENTFLLDDELHSDTDISSNYLDYSSDDSCSELSSDEDLSSARIFTEVDVKNPPVPCPRFKFSRIPSVHVQFDDTSELFGKLDEPREVEPLNPPKDSKPGDRVFVEGYESSEPDEQLNPKKKVWETLQPDLKTSSSCVAEWQGNPLIAPSGVITCNSMKGAPIK
ncbi:Tyrosine--tRNA ligase, cytoplasmic [Araneus ventricosus]|uniref:Tyrosine--tRNA ligase, cytoplasmic n=1 Tax=Araneus ventricosus TaxID=182803 RepID=A0A4Y2SJV9_ARAVE|nr:Tyrosine--tRNA ligase, cytoplasmic [Araneus ventricosus]